ncbi:hypothetical protein Mapa_001870 [Marchantia paleacea]|nr:hypothetical protein Mapa_001870 [Marchantia paleacea]
MKFFEHKSRAPFLSSSVRPKHTQTLCNRSERLVLPEKLSRSSSLEVIKSSGGSLIHEEMYCKIADHLRVIYQLIPKLPWFFVTLSSACGNKLSCLVG